MADPGTSGVRARAWSLVLVAAVFEIAWAVGLPFTEGFTRLGPTMFVVGAMAGSFVPLARAVRVLPIGPAYATWTGLGAAGTAILAVFIHGEPLEVGRMLAILMIVAGVVGLRLLDTGKDAA